MGLLRKILNEIEEGENKKEKFYQLQTAYGNIGGKLKTIAKKILRLASDEEGKYREIVSNQNTDPYILDRNANKTDINTILDNPNHTEEAIAQIPLDLERKFPTFAMEIKYPLDTDANGKVDTRKALEEGTMLVPSYVYTGNLNRTKDIIDITGNLDSDETGVSLMSLSVPKINIKTLQWQYIYDSWERTGKHTQADKSYILISNQNVYIKLGNISDAEIQSQVATEIAGNDTEGKTLTTLLNTYITNNPQKNGVNNMWYSNWHIFVARAFIKINNEELGVSVLPAYGDVKTQKKEMEDDEKRTNPIFIGVAISNGDIVTTNTNGMENSSVPVQVDHINGDNTNNSAANLRIVQQSQNTADAHIYKMYRWIITNSTSQPIYARLEYDAVSAKTTGPRFYYDMNFKQPLNPDDVDMVKATKEAKVVASNALESSELTGTSLVDGTTVIKAQGSGILYQLPIVITFGRRNSYIAKSAQEAGIVAGNRTPRQMIHWARWSIKHKKIPQNISDNVITYVGFATNQLITLLNEERYLNEAKGKKIMQADNSDEEQYVDNNDENQNTSGVTSDIISKDPEYTTRKIRQIIRNYGAGANAKNFGQEDLENGDTLEDGENENNGNSQNPNETEMFNRETLVDIFNKMQDENLFNETTDGGVNYNTGVFYMENRNNLDKNYTNFNHIYEDEVWYRGLYFPNFNTLTFGKITGQKKVLFLAAKPITNGILPRTNDDNRTFKIYDPISQKFTESEGIGYTVMCSNMNRIAQYKSVYNTWEISLPDYFVQYPHIERDMEEYSYDLSKEYNDNLSDNPKATGIEYEDKTLALHILIMSSLRFNEYISLFKNVNEMNFGGANKVFVHHRNEDTAIFAYKNLELVSNYDNSLFSRGFTCMVLFEKLGGREIPIVGWPLIGTSIGAGYNYKYKDNSYVTYVSPLDYKRISIKLPTSAAARTNMKYSEQFMPDFPMESNYQKRAYIFRECLTKDFRVLDTSPEQVAQLVIAYVQRDEKQNPNYILFKSIDEGIDESGNTVNFLEMGYEEYENYKRNKGKSPEELAKYKQIDRELQLLSRREFIPPESVKTGYVHRVTNNSTEGLYAPQTEPYTPYPLHSQGLTPQDVMVTSKAPQEDEMDGNGNVVLKKNDKKQKRSMKYTTLRKRKDNEKMLEEIKRIHNLMKRMK